MGVKRRGVNTYLVSAEVANDLGAMVARAKEKSRRRDDLLKMEEEEEEEGEDEDPAAEKGSPKPAQLASNTLVQLLVPKDETGALGLSFEQYHPNVVEEVKPDSWAEKAGLHRGDVVIAVNQTDPAEGPENVQKDEEFLSFLEPERREILRSNTKKSSSQDFVFGRGICRVGEVERFMKTWGKVYENVGEQEREGEGKAYENVGEQEREGKVYENVGEQEPREAGMRGNGAGTFRRCVKSSLRSVYRKS